MRMVKIYKSLFPVLLMLISFSGLFGQNTVLVYSEDFENGPGSFLLNSPGPGSNVGPNQWIINDSYNGQPLYPNTQLQSNTVGGDINFAPRSNYLHISDSLAWGQGIVNANFRPGDSSDRFVSTMPFCTQGLDSVRMAFFIHCEGNPGAFASLYYSVNGGSWTPVTGAVYSGISNWRYFEVYDDAFDNVANLRFGFRWQNGASNAAPSVSVGIDGVRIVGKLDRQLYNIRLEIDTVIPNPVCRGRSISVTIDNPVPLCGSGQYLVQLSNEFGLFNSPADLGGFNLSNSISRISLPPLNLPRNLNPGNCYKVRVIRVDLIPALISQESECIVIEDCPNSVTTLTAAVLNDVADTVCLGSVIDMKFNSNGLFQNNTYTLELSDSNGLFPQFPNVIGFKNDDAEYPGDPGSVPGLFREQNQPIPPGCNYYLRVVASSPRTIGTVYGPFCIRECDIESNLKQDIQLCISETQGVDTAIQVRIKQYPPEANYSPPNEFQLQVLDFQTFDVINTGVIGSVSAVSDTVVILSLPPLPQLLQQTGLTPKNYYLRIIATNSDQPWDLHGTVVRLTIGGPQSSPLAINLLDEFNRLISPFSGDTTFCLLGVWRFQVPSSIYNPNSSYTWSLNNNPNFVEIPPNDPNRSNIGILFDVPGTHTVGVREENYGCLGPGSAIITLNVRGFPDASILGPARVCQGDTVNYRAILNEDTYYSWRITPGELLENQANEGVFTFPETPRGTISIEVINECGSATNERVILVGPPPEFEVVDDQNICAGEEVHLSVTGPSGTRASWFHDGDVVGQSNSLTILPDSSTQYTVRTYHVSFPECFGYDTVTVSVSDPVVLPDVMYVVCPGDEAVLSVDTLFYSLQWSTGESSQSITAGFGIYPVSILFENHPCAAIQLHEVLEEPCFLPLILPNTFSPNDDGFNAVFKAGQTFSYDKFRIEIYNRWGMKVYESADPYFEWPGTDQGGKPLPSGTYFYITNYQHQDKGEDLTGFITLIRD